MEAADLDRSAHDSEEAGKRTTTVLHVSHPKSGSTWITRIFRRLAPDRFVQPAPDLSHLEGPLTAGGVYPRVYLERERVEALDTPPETEILLTIRDLRDTLVSGYWSLKESHQPRGNVLAVRAELAERSVEDGLLWMLDNWLPGLADIQRSWIGFEPMIRYEDLLEDDLGILVPELSGRLGLGSVKDAERAVLACRFEAESGGRERGAEDRGSHYRKGVAGDWRNYLGEGRLKETFKERHAEDLILTGYETSDDW